MKLLDLTLFLAVALSLAGCIVFYRKKPSLSGRLGAIFIVISGTSFVIRVFLFAITKEGAERLVLLGFGALAGPAVIMYWLRVWQRKRPDAVTENSA